MSARPLTRGECVDLLAQVPIGRVGVTIGAMPAILPVNFRLDGDSVLFGVMPGSRLAMATNASIVAFQADSYDAARRTGWAVMGVGPSRRVALPDRRLSKGPLLPEAWAIGEEAEHLVQIELVELSGIEITGPPTGGPCC